MPPVDADHPLAAQFRNFVRDSAFCCIGAKSALARNRLRIVVARDITSGWSDLDIHPALLAFTRGYRRKPSLFQSFAVVFEGPSTLSETEFETALWDRLQSLTDKDAWQGHDPDPTASTDIADPHFAVSFGGQGYFVVGLHPNASRPARRFASPVMVFNLHDQFTRLRRMGAYEKLRDSIIARDIAQAGSVNPMLARYGTVSEARQYSGRPVAEDWGCPFHRPTERHRDAA